MEPGSVQCVVEEDQEIHMEKEAWQEEVEVRDVIVNWEIGGTRKLSEAATTAVTTTKIVAKAEAAVTRTEKATKSVNGRTTANFPNTIRTVHLPIPFQLRSSP